MASREFAVNKGTNVTQKTSVFKHQVAWKMGAAQRAARRTSQVLRSRRLARADGLAPADSREVDHLAFFMTCGKEIVEHIGEANVDYVVGYACVGWAGKPSRR